MRRHVEVVAPEGGWGWVVVLGAFVNGMVAAGFTSLISVLYIEWTAEFHVGATEMSWIGFLFPASAGIVSIVIGYIWSKIGVRRTAVLGAILSTAGCLAGSFSSQPFHVAITIGVISGVGVGLCHISSVNIVAIYFNTRFGLANGIMFLGTSFSQVGMPPLTRFLVASFGWRGALQISSALMAHGVAAASLFRSLKSERKKQTTLGCNNETFESDATTGNDIIEMDAIYYLSTPVGTPVVQRKQRFDKIAQSTDHKTAAGVRQMRSKNHLSPRTFRPDKHNQNAHTSFATDSEIDHRPEVSCTDQSYGKRNLKSDSSKKRPHPNMDTDGRSFSKEVRTMLADMLAITFFRHEPLAILQNVSSIVVMIGTFPPVAHVMAMAIDRGITHSDAASLLSVLGVGGTLGRVLAGVVADKHIIGPHLFMMISNILTAVPIALLPFVIPVFAHAAITIFFAGIGIGSSIVLRVIQAKSVVSPSFISDAVRIVILTTGLGMTIGAVLSGWIADITGSYSMSFYFAADVLLFGAAINLSLSIITRCREKPETADGQMLSLKAERGGIQDAP